MKNKPDKYDRAIGYLIENPDVLYGAWLNPFESKNAGCLFMFATPTGGHANRPDGKDCGCLTTIHRDAKQGIVAWSDELTKAILADKRIPTEMESLAMAFPGMNLDQRYTALEPFRDWQRRFDKEIRSPA